MLLILSAHQIATPFECVCSCSCSIGCQLQEKGCCCIADYTVPAETNLIPFSDASLLLLVQKVNTVLLQLRFGVL